MTWITTQPDAMDAFSLHTDKNIAAGSMVLAVLDVAEARGANRQRLLRGTGIFEEDVATGSLVSARQLLTLLGNAQAQARSRDTAFQIGKSLASSHLSPTLNAMRACYSLTDILRIVTLYRHTFSPLISLRRFDHRDEAIFILEDAIGCGKSWSFVVEMFTSMWVALTRLWCDSRVPLHFTFVESPPRQRYEYEEHLGYRITFGAPILSVRLPRQWLAYPFPDRHQAVRAQLLCGLAQQRFCACTLLDVIRDMVRANPNNCLEHTASQLGMSVATLKRKLKEHNSSYRVLADETRRQQAIYLLAEKKLSNECSAVNMAFTDLTNFRRAVKRWTGQTPSALRRT